MPDHHWPVHRARAWLLRKAAEIVESGDVHRAKWLTEWAFEDDPVHGATSSEKRFREFARNNWGGDAPDALVDRAVAEVYGDATPVGLRPAEEIAREMVRELHGGATIEDQDMFVTAILCPVEIGQLRSILVRLITRSRAEGLGQREALVAMTDRWASLAERLADPSAPHPFAARILADAARELREALGATPEPERTP